MQAGDPTSHQGPKTGSQTTAFFCPFQANSLDIQKSVKKTTDRIAAIGKQSGFTQYFIMEIQAMKKAKSIYEGLIAAVVLASVSTAAHAGPFDSWEEFWYALECFFGWC